MKISIRFLSLYAIHQTNALIAQAPRAFRSCSTKLNSVDPGKDYLAGLENIQAPLVCEDTNFFDKTLIIV